MISIGTIGLIKAVSTFDASKGTRLATYAARCVENEILMYFRSQRKSAQDVSLSDYIETGSDGAALSLMDVVSEDADLLEQVTTREAVRQLRQVMNQCLTGQEHQVITMRFGLDGTKPKRQREVAQVCGISRSYISRIEKRALEKLRAALEG
ncbi:MAG: sigma-70 family RNA polymerase sigma factor [Oscillospiraceae bacterium]|nr:sigma-70 family RNA polymerase sigma factor [Oscillospiraceae bacterium]